MPTVTLTLPKPHAGQRAVLDSDARFRVVCCGRRWGKSVLAGNRLIDGALRGRPVAYFAPTYRMLLEVWRDVWRASRPVLRRVNVQERRLEYATGGVVEFWSLDTPDVARGRKYARAVIDEAAMIPQLQEAWESVIRPTLIDFKGDAWFKSTPRGLNYFYRLWRLGQDANEPEWRSWQMPTAANPHIPADEIEAMRRTLPERVFAQEVLAQFLDDGGGVFRKVQEAATATRQDRAIPGDRVTPAHEYVMGVDVARDVDFTVISVLDATTREQVYQDRFNQLDFAIQAGRIRALHERFRPRVIVVERNSMGIPFTEQLLREGLPVLPFTTTAATKAPLIDGLALAFERGDLRILDDPVLVGELLAYEAERLPSGTLRYGAPAGQHDDCVMALALAYHAMTAGAATEIEAPW